MGRRGKFLAHRSADKSAARALAEALLARGIDVWFDEWEIQGGDNFVDRMEDGLTACDGGLLFCTATGFDGAGKAEKAWTYQEYSVLLARVVEGRGGGTPPFLIPIRSGPNPVVPAFLSIRHARDASDIDGIVDDILQHVGLRGSNKPPLGKLDI